MLGKKMRPPTGEEFTRKMIQKGLGPQEVSHIKVQPLATIKSWQRKGIPKSKESLMGEYFVEVNDG